MMALGNVVQFHGDEALTSFVSRLASSNFCSSVQEFCSLIDIRFHDVVAGDRKEVARLLDMAGIDRDAVESSIVSSGRLFNEMNGETLTRSTFTRSRLRYCPHCIDDDIRMGTGRKVARPYVRMHWQVSFVRSCPLHGVLLREGTDAGIHHHDFSVLFEKERIDPQNCEAAVCAEYTAFERYVAERVWGHNERRRWGDQLPLYVVGRLSEWVGATIMFGRQFLSKDIEILQWHEAAQKGFDIVGSGREAFVEFLKSMHDIFWDTKHHVGGRSLYGRLYEKLAHESDDTGYDEIRSIMTETAINHLPLGPGDMMMGAVTRRKLHSLHSLSCAMVWHPITLRKVLVDAGWIGKEAAGLSPERIVFDARKAEEFVRGLCDLMKPSKARTHLNATRTLWDTLVRDGFITPALSPATGGPGTKVMYRRADLDAFVEKLRAGASADHDTDVGRVQIPAGAKKAKCRQTELLQLLIDGVLENAAIDPDGRGMEAILVDVSEIREKTTLADHGGLSLVEASKELELQPRILDRLIEHGLVKSELAINLRNRCPQQIVRTEEIDRFQDEYVSLFNYAARLGVHFAEAKNSLEAAGVVSALTTDMVGATFYRWNDIRAAGPRFAELGVSFAFS